MANIATIAIPAALKVLVSIISGLHPPCAVVGRPGPVSLMPFVLVTHWIPVAGYPGVIRARTSRLYPNNTRRWRCADSNSDGNLCGDRPHCQQHQHNQFGFHDLTLSFHSIEGCTDIEIARSAPKHTWLLSNRLSHLLLGARHALPRECRLVVIGIFEVVPFWALGIIACMQSLTRMDLDGTPCDGFPSAATHSWQRQPASAALVL